MGRAWPDRSVSNPDTNAVFDHDVNVRERDDVEKRVAFDDRNESVVLAIENDFVTLPA